MHINTRLIIVIVVSIVSMGCNGDEIVIQNQLIDMHDNILHRTGSLSNSEGRVEVSCVERRAAKGSNKVVVQSTDNFYVSQLVCYRMLDQQWYTNTINAIDHQHSILFFSHHLEDNISVRDSIFSFYHDSCHPVTAGYYAIADHSIEKMGQYNLNYGVHVLFGDSWFDSGQLGNRIQEKLPDASIINKGHSGDTAEKLLSRFDSDVAIYAPDFVWILAGTNDYNHSYSPEKYINFLSQIIDNANEINATAIVFDPSVGAVGTDMESLSHQYAIEIQNLFN